MGVRLGRAAPGSQVLPDFVVISCPWRATSVDQGSLYGTLLRKRQNDFSKSVQISFNWDFEKLPFGRFFYFPKFLLFRDSYKKNPWVSFAKETHIGWPDPRRLPFEGSLSLQNLVGPAYLQVDRKNPRVVSYLLCLLIKRNIANRKPPPWGEGPLTKKKCFSSKGVLFLWTPVEEFVPGASREVLFLRAWLGNIVNRKSPRDGGVLSMNLKLFF